jgi:hypothetical protein
VKLELVVADHGLALPCLVVGSSPNKKQKSNFENVTPIHRYLFIKKENTFVIDL